MELMIGPKLGISLHKEKGGSNLTVTLMKESMAFSVILYDN